MNEFDSPQALSLEAVYFDEHLIQLEAVIDVGDWRGRARAYTVREDIATFATMIQQFTDGKATPPELVAGADDGIGLIRLRFYRIDRAGHIAGFISLATDGGDTDHRPEQVSRLAVEFGAEVWPLAQFAAQLKELAQTQIGCASLPITTLS